jgi:hypothetical protein
MPFHSAQVPGKLPTWYELPPMAHGSAMKSVPTPPEAARGVKSRRMRLSAVPVFSLS